MKKIWILLIGLLAVLHLEAKENKDTNVAYQDGNVRFTVIDEGVIRLEWHADAQFVDAASFWRSTELTIRPIIVCLSRRIG